MRFPQARSFSQDSSFAPLVISPPLPMAYAMGSILPPLRG